MLKRTDSKTEASQSATRMFDSWSLPIMMIDRDMRFIYANAAYLNSTHKTMVEIQGRDVFDCFPDTPERVKIVRDKFETTLTTGEVTKLDRQPFELTYEDGHTEERIWQASQDPIRDEHGEIVALVQRAEDITSQVQLEQRNEAISHELTHRVKNIMAVVTSIARITGRHAVDVPSFVSSFTSRISAMSRTSDFLARTEYSGLTIDQILHDELAPYKEEQARTFTLEGPEVRLSLDASKDLAMVVHELATNAAKYGCLGDMTGALSVTWTRDAERLQIIWSERCAGEISPPKTTGFGTRLFDLLPHIDVERSFEPQGLQLTITISDASAFA